MLDSIIQVVQSLGFPIAVAVACGLYVKYRDDKNDDKITSMQTAFLEEMAAERADHKTEVNGVTQAINNNTLVIQKLYDKLAEE